MTIFQAKEYINQQTEEKKTELLIQAFLAISDEWGMTTPEEVNSFLSEYSDLE